MNCTENLLLRHCSLSRQGSQFKLSYRSGHAKFGSEPKSSHITHQPHETLSANTHNGIKEVTTKVVPGLSALASVYLRWLAGGKPSVAALSPALDKRRSN
jgi:hypothetical protein